MTSRCTDQVEFNVLQLRQLKKAEVATNIRINYSSFSASLIIFMGKIAGDVDLQRCKLEMISLFRCILTVLSERAGNLWTISHVLITSSNRTPVTKSSMSYKKTIQVKLQMIRYSIIEVDICLLSVCFNGDPTNVPHYPKNLQKYHGSAYIS